MSLSFKMRNNDLNKMNEFLDKNGWAIFAFCAMIIGGFIFGYATLNSRVDVIAKQINAYPSNDYFTLKFQDVNEKLDTLETKVDIIQKNTK